MTETLLLALIGNPVAHSKSPLIHQAFGDQFGLAVDYRKVLAPLCGFGDTVAELRSEGARGCNVTIPFKQQAFDVCDRLTERAQRAGAVNTMLFETGGVLGDNTDGTGLMRDITQNLRIDVTDSNVLLVGAGGAARGVVAPLFAAGIGRLHIANRTPAKADLLSRDFADLGTISASSLAGIPATTFDLIINATSAGLEQSTPDLPAACMADGGAAYDLVYAAASTPFMLWAESAGAAITAEGTGMLLEQAAEGFHLWTGLQADVDPVRELLRSS